jgi:hypothetical protein
VGLRVPAVGCGWWGGVESWGLTAAMAAMVAVATYDGTAFSL